MPFDVSSLSVESLILPVLLAVFHLVVVFFVWRNARKMRNSSVLQWTAAAFVLPIFGAFIYFLFQTKQGQKMLRSTQIGKYVFDIFSNRSILGRFAFTIVVVIVYRLLANIPLPGIDMNVYQNFFGSTSTSEAKYLLTVFTGGQLETPSIVGLGIGVYITASIIIQLLSSVIPQLEELSKEGARGKQILDQYTRYLTLPLSILYSVGFLILISQQSLSGTDTSAPTYLLPRNIDGSISIMRIAFMTIVLSAGSLIMMWLAELITEKGITNGASLLIMVGILASLPALVSRDFGTLNPGAAIGEVLKGNASYLQDPALIGTYLIIGGGILLVAGIIFITESTRKVPIQYARRERTGQVQESFLPLKLNQSGVLPIIFASSFLTVPQLVLPFLIQITDASSPIGQFARSAQNSPILSTTTVTLEHNIFYFLLIIVFSLFYAFVALKPDQVAENLQKSGGFVPGIRPGQATEEYITKVMLRLTVVGALFLGAIALIPTLAGATLFSLTAQQFNIFTGIGGTSILIVVGVILDGFRQLESLRATQNYEKYI